MDKNLKFALGAIAVLLIIILLYNIFGLGGGLSEALKNLKESTNKIDSAMHKIDDTQGKLDKLKERTDSFKQFTSQAGNNVDTIDAQRKTSETKFKDNQKITDSKLKALEERIKQNETGVQAAIPRSRL